MHSETPKKQSTLHSHSQEEETPPNNNQPLFQLPQQQQSHQDLSLHLQNYGNMSDYSSKNGINSTQKFHWQPDSQSEISEIYHSFHCKLQQKIKSRTKLDKTKSVKVYNKCFVHEYFDYDPEKQMAICKLCIQKIWVELNDFAYLHLHKHMEIRHRISMVKCPLEKETNTYKDFFYQDLLRKIIVCKVCKVTFQIQMKNEQLLEHMRSSHPEITAKKFITRPNTPEQLQKYPAGFRPRAKRSIVWKIFRIHKSFGSNGTLCSTQDTNRGKEFTGEIAICRICDFCIKRKNNYSTAELLAHFKTKHPEKYIQCKFLTSQFDSCSQTIVKQYANLALIGGKNQRQIYLKDQSKVDQSEKQCQSIKTGEIRSLHQINSQADHTQKFLQLNKQENLEESEEFLSNTIPAAKKSFSSFVWEVFRSEYESFACLLCNYAIQGNELHSELLLTKHLQRHHSEVLWLLQKQSKQGLFNFCDRV